MSPHERAERAMAILSPAMRDAVADLIAAVREQSAAIALAHVAQHARRNYPPDIRQAVQLEGRAIADAILAERFPS